MDYYRLVLDIIIASLLVATIVYATMLNKRLTALRKNRDDMAKLISHFNEATVRAESSIPKLRKAAEDAGVALQDRVEKAQSLRDDLAFMIERADAMADRLEGAVRSGRSETAKAPAPAAAAAPPPRPTPVAPRISPSPLAAALGAPTRDDVDEEERSEAERELLRALQSVR